MAKASAQKSSSAKPTAKDVGFVASTAMSRDVGEKALAAFRSAKDSDAQIKTLEGQSDVKKYETLKSLTLAFVKAAANDKSIVLSDEHSEAKDKQTMLRRKLEVAIGLRDYAKGEDGTETYKLSAVACQYFPAPGEDPKKDPAIQKKETFRGNFGAVFKKAILAAHAITLKDIKVTEKAGTLQLEGRAIQERFKVNSVTLDEVQTVTVPDGKGGTEKKKLAKIPSYTEIGRISAESVGKTVQTRAQSAARLSGGKVTEADLIAVIKSLQESLPKLKNFSDELATALEGLQETIETSLSENGQDE